MPQNLTIFQLNSGSVSNDSMTFLGQPGSGSLYKISFQQIFDFLASGSGTAYNPTQLNQFSASILTFTGSIAAELLDVFASQSGYLSTSSFDAFSASLQTYNPAELNLFTASISGQVSNVYASQSLTSQSLGALDSTVSNVSFLVGGLETEVITLEQQIIGISGSYLNTASFDSYTASLAIQVGNVYSSQSLYTHTSSFNSFTGSYVTDSASFNARINSITGSGGGGVSGSFVTTSSFNSFTASYHNDSSSFNNRIINFTGSTVPQFVIGENNIPDSSSLFIIGNGSSSLSQSDAFKIDASGNITIPGSITTGYSNPGVITTLNTTLILESPGNVGIQAVNQIYMTAGSDLLTIFTESPYSGYNVSVNGTMGLNGNLGLLGGLLELGTNANNQAQINFATSSAPSAPNNGDVWFDGANFNARISGTTEQFSFGGSSSGSAVNTGSLLLTSSFNTYTSSISTQIANVYASESKYLLTSSLQQNGIGTTITSPLFLQNATSASSGNQQISPAIHFQGQGWMTSTPASQPVDGYIYMLPVQGSTVAGSTMVFALSQNNGAITNVMTLNEGGGLGLTGALTISNNCFIGAANGYTWGTAGTTPGLYSDSNYEMSIRQGTHPCQLQVYNTYTSNTNNEAGLFGFQSNSNVLSIGTEATGSGTLRQTQFVGGTVNMIATAIKRTTVTGSYTALPTDYLIAYTTLNAAATASLPSAIGVTGQQYIIIDETGNANTNNITVLPSGSQTISGGSSKIINTSYGVIRLYSTGTNWMMW